MGKTIIPRRCLLCGDFIFAGENTGICAECCKKIPAIRGKTCGKCGKPLLSEQKLCLTCRERDFFFQKNISIFEYAGPVKELIKKYKFNSNKILALWFAGRLAAYLKNTPAPVTVVPVPGNPESIRKRGWDQLEEIAGILRLRYGFSVKSLLSRKASRQQKTLSFRQRCENLRGKIAVKAGPLPGKGNSIVLIDDVFTTGATVSECARVLQKTADSEGKIVVVTIAID